MFIRYLILISLVFSAVSCGGIKSSRERRSPDDDRDRREGNFEVERDDGTVITDTPETIAGKLGKILNKLKNKLKNIKNCESSTPGVPYNSADLVASMFGFTLPTTQLRECLSQNLEEATSNICQTKRDLETQYRKYRNHDIRRDRIDSALERVDRMEDDYRNNILQIADRLYARSDRSKNWFVEEEYLALANILDQEGSISCSAYYLNDDRRRY